MKKIITLALIFSLIPNLVFAAPSLFSKEQTLIPKEISQEVGTPEGAGIVMGLNDIDLEKPVYMTCTSTYSYQQVIEKIKALFITSDKEKISYYFDLAQKRLSEISQATKDAKPKLAKISLKKAAKFYEKIYNILKKQDSKILDNSDLETVSNHMTILTILEDESTNSSNKSEFEDALKYLLLIQAENDKL